MNKHKYLRQPTGASHYNSRLSESEVLEILELSQYIPVVDIAKAYSISVSTAHFIKTGTRWAKLTKVKYVPKFGQSKKKKVGKVKAENIRKLYKLGQSQCSLAKKYKVSQPVIFDIVHRRTHV